jgi:hypothetical protein
MVLDALHRSRNDEDNESKGDMLGYQHTMSNPTVTTHISRFFVRSELPVRRAVFPSVNPA